MPCIYLARTCHRQNCACVAQAVIQAGACWQQHEWNSNSSDCEAAGCRRTGLQGRPAEHGHRCASAFAGTRIKHASERPTRARALCTVLVKQCFACTVAPHTRPPRCSCQLVPCRLRNRVALRGRLSFSCRSCCTSPHGSVSCAARTLSSQCSTNMAASSSSSTASTGFLLC